jgi:hypothetical protein
MNSNLVSKSWTRAALLASLVVPLGSSSAHAKDEPILYLNCFTISMDTGQSGMLEIAIERWSDPSVLNNLKAVLVEQGPDKLLSALQKVKPRAGFIRTSNSVGWDIHYARESELPGGVKKVVIATDRPIGFWEARADNRSTDYEFTLAEIRLDKKGGLEGEGKLVTAAKITYNKETKQIEIENYGNEPLRLSDVKVQVPKDKKK